MLTFKFVYERNLLILIQKYELGFKWVLLLPSLTKKSLLTLSSLLLLLLSLPFPCAVSEQRCHHQQSASLLPRPPQHAGPFPSPTTTTNSSGLQFSSTSSSNVLRFRPKNQQQRLPCAAYTLDSVPHHRVAPPSQQSLFFSPLFLLFHLCKSSHLSH